MMILKIGEYIKIHPDLKSNSWYSKKIKKITGHHEGFDGDILYKINHINDNFSIHPTNCFQDVECINKLRENKLRKILKN